MSEEKVTPKEIICPYCQNKISSEEICYQFDSIDIMTSPMLRHELQPEMDEVFQSYWRNRNMTDEFIKEKKVVSREELNNLNQALEESSNPADAYAKIKFIPQGRGDYSSVEVETGVDRVSADICCPRCHNRLPNNIFRYEMHTVGMVGRSQSGKTCFATSMLCGFGQELVFKDEMGDVILEGRYCDNASEFMEGKIENDIERMMNQKCPLRTEIVFVPPIFLEIEYKGRWILLVLYDISGEVLKIATDHPHDQRVQYLKNTSDYIYMMEPNEIGLHGDDVGSISTINPANIQKVVLSAEERKNALQQKESKTIQEVLKEKNAIKTHISLGNGVLDNFHLLVNLRGTRRNGHIAFTVLKSDEIKGNSKIKEVDPDNLLFKQNVGKIVNRREDILRKKAMSDLFRNHLFNPEFVTKNRLKSYSLHMISALGGGTRKVIEDGTETYEMKEPWNPTRVGEPIFQIILNHAEEMGWE
ncbi:MAG: hypothetical protein EOM40_04980 [Clostridia bacterium]|nr:hypothetical protein [Clostridia bacterium]NCC42098.1 hypothetical protein [Clostridia bacterium]